MAPQNGTQVAFRPLSRSSDFAAQGDWSKMQNTVDRSPACQPRFHERAPTSVGDVYTSQTAAPDIVAAQVTQSAPYRAFTEPGRTDEFYNRYHKLSRNIAFRYPDPGQPRQREGSIGGSWRHIKEVLGHGGSRVVFVDGLVRLYDLDKSMLRSKKTLPMTASLQLPSHYKEDRQLIKAEEHKQKCQPWVEGPQLPPISQPHDLPGEPAKYKGFYTLRD